MASCSNDIYVPANFLGLVEKTINLTGKDRRVLVYRTVDDMKLDEKLGEVGYFVKVASYEKLLGRMMNTSARRFNGNTEDFRCKLCAICMDYLNPFKNIEDLFEDYSCKSVIGHGTNILLIRTIRLNHREGDCSDRLLIAMENLDIKHDDPIKPFYHWEYANICGQKYKETKDITFVDKAIKHCQKSIDSFERLRERIPDADDFITIVKTNKIAAQFDSIKDQIERHKMLREEFQKNNLIQGCLSVLAKFPMSSRIVWQGLVMSSVVADTEAAKFFVEIGIITHGKTSFVKKIMDDSDLGWLRDQPFFEEVVRNGKNHTPYYMGGWSAYCTHRLNS